MVLCVYVKLWRRIYSEATLEASLLAEKWKLVLAGLVFQVLKLPSLCLDYSLALLVNGDMIKLSCDRSISYAGFFCFSSLLKSGSFKVSSLYKSYLHCHCFWFLLKSVHSWTCCSWSSLLTPTWSYSSRCWFLYSSS